MRNTKPSVCSSLYEIVFHDIYSQVHNDSFAKIEDRWVIEIRVKALPDAFGDFEIYCTSGRFHEHRTHEPQAFIRQDGSTFAMDIPFIINRAKLFVNRKIRLHEEYLMLKTNKPQ